VALAAGGCFSDPTSDLRAGPEHLQLSRTAVILRTGDSIDVTAYLKDAQGNTLPIEAATWAAADPAVAVVREDTILGPGGSFSRAFIRAVIDSGGITSVTFDTRGQSASIRVVVRPAAMVTRLSSLVGTATADTMITARPAPLGPDTQAFTGGDTLVLTTTGNILFDTNTVAGSQSEVTFGINRGYLLSRTPTELKVMTRTGFVGRPAVSNVLYAGNAETGEIRIDTLKADTVRMARGRLQAARVTVRTGTFGANTEVKVTPPAGMTFNAASSTVTLGATAGIILSRTADSIVAISTTNFTGLVKVTALSSTAPGGGVIDSLRTNVPATVVASNFPGTVVQRGTGRLLDTVLVIGGPIADFTTTGASASNVTINGVTALVIRRAADTLYVIAPRGGTSKVSITSIKIGTTTIPSLSTPGTITVGTATTGELNEPGNDVRGATSTVVAFTGATDTIIVYGSLDCQDDGTACPGNGDFIDWYQLAYSGGQKLRAIVTFFGTGNPGAAYNDQNNPDLDVHIRNATGGALTSGSTNGAGLINPEIGSTAAVQPAGT
jgi:hypothetical protein